MNHIQANGVVRNAKEMKNKLLKSFKMKATPIGRSQRKKGKTRKGTRKEKKKKLRENEMFPNIREKRNAGKVIDQIAAIFQNMVRFPKV